MKNNPRFQDVKKHLKFFTEELESLSSLDTCTLPFDSLVIEFIDSFSKGILKDHRFKRYPEIISLAFWMRRKNILSLHADFVSRNNNILRVACGRALHFAPSNVDTIFIYSLFLSLLSGNQNIVRVSSKNSEQQSLILSIINEIIAIPKFSKIRDNLIIVSYEHSEYVTNYFSLNCDLRIIWGGDKTIANISSHDLSPTANELKFANKYSLSIIDANKLKDISENDFDSFVTNFVNDTYWFGQQGCSSPRTVCWLNITDEISERFWVAVNEKAKELFFDNISDADIMNKLVSSDLISVRLKGQLCNIHHGRFLSRISILDSHLHNEIRDLHCGSGLFYELNLLSLKELNYLVDRKTQTISYFGFDVDELKETFISNNCFPDRLVPIGKSLEFSTQWDGYDLLSSMTRIMDFK